MGIGPPFSSLSRHLISLLSQEKQIKKHSVNFNPTTILFDKTWQNKTCLTKISMERLYLDVKNTVFLPFVLVSGLVFASIEMSW